MTPISSDAPAAAPLGPAPAPGGTPSAAVLQARRSRGRVRTGLAALVRRGSRVPVASAVGLAFALAGCAGAAETPRTPDPAAPPGRARAKEGPGDPERRQRFLAGASASEAPALVATNNPLQIDAVASFFIDPLKPYPERIRALSALRALRVQDAGEYARVFPRVRSTLWEEVQRGAGLEMSPQNEKAFIEAVGWLSDLKDPPLRPTLELHLDRDTVRRKRLSDPALCAAALGLASYPESESAGGTLWAALKDPGEAVAVRACCLKALRPFHPQDLEARVVRLQAAAQDDWLIDLQRRLR